MSRRAPDDPSDEALVTAYVAGDDAAFDTLVSRYRRRVFGICLRYFHDPHEAEEAAQETFVALLRRAETFTGAARFSSWLYRVATNCCHDLARRRARAPAPADPADGMPVETADVDDVLGRRELGMELAAALRHLEPEQRDAVVLRDVHGLPYDVVAGRLGVPVGTVKSRVHRGHAKLAVLLSHLGSPADRAAQRRGRASRSDGMEPSPSSRPPTGRAGPGATAPAEPTLEP